MLNKGSKLHGIIKNSKLIQLIDIPTRVTATSATVLDLVITNNQDLVSGKDVVPNFISDNDFISIRINITKPRRKPITKTFRQFKNNDKIPFSNLILSEHLNFNKILNTDNVNRQVNIFNENFIKCLDRCALIVTKEIKRPHKP